MWGDVRTSVLFMTELLSERQRGIRVAYRRPLHRDRIERLYALGTPGQPQVASLVPQRRYEVRAFLPSAIPNKFFYGQPGRSRAHAVRHLLPQTAAKLALCLPVLAAR